MASRLSTDHAFRVLPGSFIRHRNRPEPLHTLPTRKRPPLDVTYDHETDRLTLVINGADGLWIAEQAYLDPKRFPIAYRIHEAMQRESRQARIRAYLDGTEGEATA